MKVALLQLLRLIITLDGPCPIVRTDAAATFKSLSTDSDLIAQRLQVEVGRSKIVNKNPIGELAIRDVERELLRLDPQSGPATELSLNEACATLNTRLRSTGLSSRELLYQRDQFTGEPLHVDDHAIIMQRHIDRLANHPSSMSSKAPRGPLQARDYYVIGDLVYIKSDLDKSRARDRYGHKNG